MHSWLNKINPSTITYLQTFRLCSFFVHLIDMRFHFDFLINSLEIRQFWNTMSRLLLSPLIIIYDSIWSCT